MNKLDNTQKILSVLAENVSLPSPFTAIPKVLLIKILECLPKENWKNYFLTCKKFASFNKENRINHSIFIQKLERIIKISRLKDQNLNCSVDFDVFFPHILTVTRDYLSDDNNLKKSEPVKVVLIKVFSLFCKEAIKKNNITMLDLALNEIQKTLKNHFLTFDPFKFWFNSEGLYPTFEDIFNPVIVESLLFCCQEKKFNREAARTIIEHRLQNETSNFFLYDDFTYYINFLLIQKKADEHIEEMLTLSIDFLKNSELKNFPTHDFFYENFAKFYEKYGKANFIFKHFDALSSIKGDSCWGKYVTTWKELKEQNKSENI